MLTYTAPRFYPGLTGFYLFQPVALSGEGLGLFLE